MERRKFTREFHLPGDIQPMHAKALSVQKRILVRRRVGHVLSCH